MSRAFRDDKFALFMPENVFSQKSSIIVGKRRLELLCQLMSTKMAKKHYDVILSASEESFKGKDVSCPERPFAALRVTNRVFFSLREHL